MKIRNVDEEGRVGRERVVDERDELDKFKLEFEGATAGDADEDVVDDDDDDDNNIGTVDIADDDKGSCDEGKANGTVDEEEEEEEADVDDDMIKQKEKQIGME